MSGPNSQRLFVAIAVPDVIKGELGVVQRVMGDLIPRQSASWTKLGNMHLTLRFLGNVNRERVVGLSDVLLRAVGEFGKMKLACKRLGCFPNLRAARVIWAGVCDSENRLLNLAGRINEVTAAFAEKPTESRFKGHVTIARLKYLGGSSAKALADYVGSMQELKFGEWSVGEVQLIASELSREGSRYTLLATFPLQKVETA